jgi:polyisoprenoid-binding protein YceI
MVKKSLFAVLGAALAVPAYCADSYTVDPRHTWPQYEIMHLGFSTQRGRFDETAGKIMLDRAAKTGAVDIVIKTASLDTGFEKWNTHMKSEDFFNAEKYPEITFKADKIVFSGDKPASIPGQFTLMGVTKPVTLNVTYFNCGPHPVIKKEVCGADANTMIKRSDFGMTKSIPFIADEVRLVINVEAIKD